MSRVIRYVLPGGALIAVFVSGCGGSGGDGTATAAGRHEADGQKACEVERAEAALQGIEAGIIGTRQALGAALRGKKTIPVIPGPPGAHQSIRAYGFQTLKAMREDVATTRKVLGSC
jgi:hypothetical protein